MMKNAPHPLLPYVEKKLERYRKQYRPVLDFVARSYVSGSISTLDVHGFFVDLEKKRGRILPAFFPITWGVEGIKAREDDDDPIQLGIEVTSITAYGLWRLTKGAYYFDRDLLTELIKTPMDRIPSELLTRLPEAAPLIIFPEGFSITLGAHVFLNRNSRGLLDVIFVVYRKHGASVERAVFSIPVTDSTIDDALSKKMREIVFVNPKTRMYDPDEKESGIFLKEEARLTLPAILNAVLFLAQEEPDLSESPPRFEPSRVKRSGHTREAPEPKIILTGWRWGSAIRKTRESRGKNSSAGASVGSKRTITPHVRRAHWHLYWTGEGSRKDPAKAVPKIRWVPATLVGRAHLETPDKAPVTIRKVMDDRGKNE